MKKTLITLLTVACIISFFNSSLKAQGQIDYDQIERDIQDYLRRGKVQSNIGYGLLAGGSVMVLGGSSLFNSGYVAVGGWGAAIAGTTLLFIGSNNKNNATLLNYYREMEGAQTTEEKEAYLLEAMMYFDSKQMANRIAGTILSILGGTGILAGVGVASAGGFLDSIAGAAMIIVAIPVAALSIPFHVRASKHKRTSKFIRDHKIIPRPSFSVAPTLNMGKGYASAGVVISF